MHRNRPGVLETRGYADGRLGDGVDVRVWLAIIGKIRPDNSGFFVRRAL
jgi:hypothetical protein